MHLLTLVAIVFVVAIISVSGIYYLHYGVLRQDTSERFDEDGGRCLEEDDLDSEDLVAKIYIDVLKRSPTQQERSDYAKLITLKTLDSRKLRELLKSTKEYATSLKAEVKDAALPKKATPPPPPPSPPTTCLNPRNTMFDAPDPFYANLRKAQSGVPLSIEDIMQGCLDKDKQQAAAADREKQLLADVIFQRQSFDKTMLNGHNYDIAAKKCNSPAVLNDKSFSVSAIENTRSTLSSYMTPLEDAMNTSVGSIMPPFIFKESDCDKKKAQADTKL